MMRRQRLNVRMGCVLVLAILAFASSLATAQDWWEMSDEAFAKKYLSQAFGDDITAQSEVAWMLFARVNQQVPLGTGKVSRWERWPSNDDTFSPARAAFALDNKLRELPHLESSKVTRLAAEHFKNTPDHVLRPDEAAGEERTRNMISYDYIRGKRLNSKVGINRFLTGGNRVDFPIGAVEIKAYWVDGATDGAYQFRDEAQGVVYSLLGLHIMAKFAPTPADVFESEEPSWFWTTFEFAGNAGLAHAQGLLTYKDQLTVPQASALLKLAGLGGTPFANYRSNGTQIRFSDKKHPDILLGNTKMEAFAGDPVSQPPSKWTAWNTSCHTCHATAAAKISGQSVQFYPFRPILTGKLTEKNAPGVKGYSSMDFVWSIPFNAK